MIKVFAVIQSRLSSSRLPGKALLRMGGYPSVVLCAKRISNTGIPFVVATSSDASDDPLVHALDQNEIPFVRGSLEDVSARFDLATQDIEDENTIIIRLTADNLLPDGKFLECLVESFQEQNAVSMSTLYQDSKIPYGLSAQVCRLKHLREAIKGATLFSDRDNVFPFIDRKYGVEKFFHPGLEEDLGYLRATMDTFDDFVNLSNVFNKFSDPVHVDSLELSFKLAELPSVSNFGVPNNYKDRFISKISLGTVQLGVEYGVANQSGKPSKELAHKIISSCHRHNVRLYDTADAYGDSQKVVGQYFKKHRTGLESIVTKLSILDDLPDDASAKVIKQYVCSSVYKSCHELGMNSLDFLLLHRFEHRFKYNEAIWRELVTLRDNGVIKALGVSIVSPEEGLEALNDKDIKFIQLPFNILDWRWKQSGFVDALKSRPDIIVQVRSVLLQGLLIGCAKKLPSVPDFDFNALGLNLDSFVSLFARKNRIDLLYGYVLAQDWIDTMVVGMESMSQVGENLSLVCRDPLTKEQCDQLEEGFKAIPEMLLDPSRWAFSKTQLGEIAR